jgi:ureidoglycolate lyase
MRKAKIEELTLDSFKDFGTFANMINPDVPKIGDKPVEFFRDMLQLELGNATRVSFSVCRCEKRPEIVDISEYHNTSGEGLMPLDAEVLIHAMPASVPGDLPVDKIRIFRVPKGTFVVLKPGVWHHGMFPVNAEYANVLIALPERLYARDCIVQEFTEKQKVQITK